MPQMNDTFGPFVFDRPRRVLRKHGAAVAVGQKGLALLEALLAANGRAVSKSDLINAAWQSDNIEESNLAVQIAALRKALGTSHTGEEWIATVQRVGYQFVDPAVARAGEAGEGANPPSPASPADKPSIAVLPFLNMSSDSEQDYFSDGVTSDIITELSRWRLLSVRSRAATFRYRGSTTDIKQIALDLKTRYILEGSVRRIGERLRITVQLIDVESGNQVWAEKFDRQLSEIFAVQDQVVRTIVSTLVGRVMVADVERANRKTPNSLAAYECVLKGNSLPWTEPHGAAEATRLFAKAIGIDPNYGMAHAALAFKYLDAWKHDTEESSMVLDEACELAKRATALDGIEGSCFSVLALISLHQRAFETALQNMYYAIELNPNNQWNSGDMGIIQIYLGHADVALEYFKLAKEIDPFFAPPWFFMCMGLAHMLKSQFAEALAAFALFPVQNYELSALTAGCHARLFDLSTATFHVQQCLQLRPSFTIRHYLSKQPFKIAAHHEAMEETLRLAGLPA